MILNWNIPELYSLYSNFIFINVKRDIVSNANSLLNARKKFFNDENKWYSFKPLEYDELVLNSPIEQVVGQVYYTQKAIKDGLELIPESNKIDVDYNLFCENPHKIVNELIIKYNKLADEKLLVPKNDFKKFEAKDYKNISNLKEFISSIKKYA